MVGRPRTSFDADALERITHDHNNRASHRLLSALRLHHSIEPPPPDPILESKPVEEEKPDEPSWLPVVEEIDPPKQLRIDDINRAVCKFYGLHRDNFLSARRTMNLVVPRQVAMYLARTLTLKSLPEIGRRMGNRDHTTIMHGSRKVSVLVERADGAILNAVTQIKLDLGVS